MVPAPALGHERPQRPAGEPGSLRQGLHGEVQGGHQAVELGLGEGDRKHRGESSAQALGKLSVNSHRAEEVENTSFLFLWRLEMEMEINFINFRSYFIMQ